MFFEIEFMDGTKKIIDSRGVMQYWTSETRIVTDGWGCCMEYFITSLSQGKAIVIGDWRKRHAAANETINAANIRNIKPVDDKLNAEMVREEQRIHEAAQEKRRNITKRIEEEMEK